ncbi:MAG: hypothetical protein PHC29_05120 [Candidatus Omnitrophica bacterium]|nr:hypothetical protein [Candidatus Omnitrophota bacterium]
MKKWLKILADLRRVSRSGAVKYVPLDKGKGFFIFKKPEAPLEYTSYELDAKGIDRKKVEFRCMIFTGKEIIYANQKRKIGAYIKKYDKEINSSPEFLISNFLAARDYKIQSPKYARPIMDLFRRLGLLREKRGKVKIPDTTTQNLRWFIREQFELLSKKKPLPIEILQRKLEREVHRLFPDNPEKAEKYYWNDLTVRRLIEKHLLLRRIIFKK